MKVIDANDLIVGRLATRVAKMALLGEEVSVVNSEKAIITGSKEDIIEKYKRLFSMGVPRKGPYLHRSPEKLLRRIIRGMLPYKQPRGRDAFKRIKCYIGVPEKLKEHDLETFQEANISKVPSLKYIDIKTLSNRLGAKI
ncbi:MAG: 50S ribosomal protein L13 [Candidatus Woesearchaeota archaeon]